MYPLYVYNAALSSGVYTMNFKKILAELCEPISHADVAKTLNCSVATVRQARLEPSARARRSPPEGWEGRMASLAAQRAERLQRLAERLRQAKKGSATHA